MRQAIISIYPRVDSGYLIPSDIIFRQPYHNLGLAMSFNFTKSYFNPFSTCTLSIDNVSPKMVSLFKFDPLTYKNRPKIEIYAGESDVRITGDSYLQISLLKKDLPLIYSGHPYFFVEKKYPGGKTLIAQLSDIDAPDRIERRNDYFQGSKTPISVLTILQKITSNMKTDFTAVPELAQVFIKTDLMYNNLNVLSQILPDLSKQYNFFCYRNASQVLVFKPGGVPVASDIKKDDPIVSSSTGLIEYPTQINWTQWNVRTFFGKPKIYYPGDWMTVDTEKSYLAFGVQQGLIVEGNYQFNDSSAEIIYKFSPNGQPVETNPIMQL